MANAKVSIVIPVYGVEEYLPRCLDSLLSQSFREWEAICVNDGSPDRCGEILADYSARDGRIRVFTQANSGVSAARNKGLSEARGEYVCFMDPDDELAPRFTELLLAAVEQTGADFAWCDHLKGAERGEWQLKGAQGEICTDVFARFLAENPNMGKSVWNKMYRRELLEGLRFPTETGMGEDIVFLCQALYRAAKAAHVPEALYFYRMRESSAMNSGLTEKVVFGNIKTGELLGETFRDKHLSPQTRKNLDRRIAQRIFKFAFLEPRRKDPAHFAEWCAKTRPLLADLKSRGIYCPQYLKLRNRLKSWVFLKGVDE